MKRQRLFLAVWLGAALMLSAGCGNRAKKGEKTALPTFPAIVVPTMVTEPQAVADYVTQHYWDRFEFTDTAFLAAPEVLEQALSDYLYLLSSVGEDQAVRNMAEMMKRARADTAMYRYFVEETDHYLWDPNSPYRNETLYIPVLEDIISFSQADPATRTRSEYRLNLARQNRPGMIAADFPYTLNSGESGQMRQIRSEYLILFFNNPGCNACAEITVQIGQSPLLNRLQQEKQGGMPRLTVLAIYTDEDLEAWREHLPEMPAHWINSYDKGASIKNTNLYDLKAVPTLYLLDRDKRVILKDTDVRMIEAYLQEATNAS
ncbi:MAG: DUF5106 domain-containing protein [Rikenellaceae bacterium]|jgi:hypothetical protein|nr:DUF5106 domain-containing protein [Rikenellaceae bacterium]